MSSASESWQSTLNNGLIYPDRKAAPVATSMITKSLAGSQIEDMKHNRFEVVADNSRLSKLKFNNKRRYAAHRAVSFMPQE